MEDKQAEEIVEIFKEAGMKIELGAQYSVKGQIAQLLNGCERLLHADRVRTPKTGRDEAEGEG